MSTIKEVYLQCDFCNEITRDCKGTSSCSVKIMRQQAIKGGWKRLAGKDKCPDCVLKDTLSHE